MLLQFYQHDSRLEEENNESQPQALAEQSPTYGPLEVAALTWRALIPLA